MAKLGRAFEQVVADVVKEFDPSAEVVVGEWVKGPDGLRELDVLINGTVEGVRRRVLIECKDFNSRRRPVGIAVIDAADSKHRDLAIDLSLVCSNAGFSKEAVRKAGRVGIGLIGVLKEDDPRIRYKIFDEIYLRRVELSQKADVTIHLMSGVPMPGPVTDLMFQGAPVLGWLQHRFFLFIAHNRVVNGTHLLRFRFKQPIFLEHEDRSAFATEISITVTLTGHWVAQKVEIDATSGLYDWLRKRIRVPSSGGPVRTTYRDVKFGTGGTVIDSHPDIGSLSRLEEGELHMELLDLSGFAMPANFAQLDPFIVAEDAAPVRPNIPPEAYRS